MIKQENMKRGAGVLLAISSLPSPYGIGTFGRSAYEFVNFLYSSGQKYWQVLPLGATSYGDSPYQSFSSFAGNPYFIDLDILARAGLLKREELKPYAKTKDADIIDYNNIYSWRFSILRKAFNRCDCRGNKKFIEFCNNNAQWLEPYAQYMAIKSDNNDKSWLEWPIGLRTRDSEEMNKCLIDLKVEMEYWRFIQYHFYMQWNALKAYANNKSIQIIGDIPIYVALDSTDVWSEPELFQLDENLEPLGVAGVPPDMFSETGQLWGNPLYDWDYMAKDDFAWWKKRMKICSELYDIVRIDHFIGIANYFSIPAKDITAENGVWKKGPGMALLEAISKVMGDKKIIAEDLGVVTPLVREMQVQSGYPGMKLMMQGFNSDAFNDNLPGFFDKNTVVYGGTHDNETMVGYFKTLDESSLAFAREYLNIASNKKIPKAIIRAAYASTANVAIFQMQDYLGLDNKSRMNTPSTLGGNWLWRLEKSDLTPSLAAKLNKLTKLYAR